MPNRCPWEKGGAVLSHILAVAVEGIAQIQGFEFEPIEIFAVRAAIFSVTVYHLYRFVKGQLKK
jgi:hypothetical protein